MKNTVTLPLEKYHELLKFEDTIKKGFTLIRGFDHYRSYSEYSIYTKDEAIIKLTEKMGDMYILRGELSSVEYKLKESIEFNKELEVNLAKTKIKKSKWYQFKK